MAKLTAAAEPESGRSQALQRVENRLFRKTSAAPEKELTPQQAKMKSCNADASAKGLKGADRKAFTSTCLKG